MGMVVLVDEQQLAGGVANAGRVTRSGEHVLRPSGPYSGSVRAFLRSLRAAGFAGAPLPAGVLEDGRERLEFIEGDVPLPPYPKWAQSDEALVSVAVLLRRFHRVSGLVGLSGASWSSELADPAGGRMICHNDVCLENVVFHGSEAVALLDFDFAAPGRPVYDAIGGMERFDRRRAWWEAQRQDFAAALR
jgi:phosphotransferase family enzyme